MHVSAKLNTYHNQNSALKFVNTVYTLCEFVPVQGRAILNTTFLRITLCHKQLLGFRALLYIVYKTPR